MKVHSIKLEIGLICALLLAAVLVVFTVIFYAVSCGNGPAAAGGLWFAQGPTAVSWRNWLGALGLCVPPAALLTHVAAKMIADKVLRCVHRITDMAKDIIQQDLAARIEAGHFDRDMGPLIGSFNEMISRLEHSFKHIEQFSYHAAHALKTPLTIIQGEANLLLRKDRSAHEYKQALRIVLEESQRVLKTVDDLLLLTKLDYHREVFKFERFDFVEFIYEIVEQNRLLVANKGVGIRMDFQNTGPALIVSGDRLHLRRSFFNIIDNAIRFTPPEGCIDIGIRRSNGMVISAISDTGPGIPTENLKKIFESFYRGDKSGGSGLGLNIAYTIIKLHHGDIRAESRMGSGTTFKVVLPLEN